MSSNPYMGDGTDEDILAQALGLKTTVRDFVHRSSKTRRPTVVCSTCPKTAEVAETRVEYSLGKAAELLTQIGWLVNGGQLLCPTCVGKLTKLSHEENATPQVTPHETPQVTPHDPEAEALEHYRFQETVRLVQRMDQQILNELLHEESLKSLDKDRPFEALDGLLNDHASLLRHSPVHAKLAQEFVTLVRRYQRLKDIADHLAELTGWEWCEECDTYICLGCEHKRSSSAQFLDHALGLDRTATLRMQLQTEHELGKPEGTREDERTNHP